MTLAQTHETRPSGEKAGPGSTPDAYRVPHGGTARQELTPLENAQLRIFRDIWMESQALYWERRAEQLEWCRPRPGDFTGRATPDEIAARDARLALEIEQCHAHALILRGETRD